MSWLEMGKATWTSWHLYVRFSDELRCSGGFVSCSQASCMLTALQRPITAASCDERWRGDATREAGQRHVLLRRRLAKAKAKRG